MHRQMSAQPESPDPLLTAKILRCVRHKGQRVRDEVIAGLPPALRPAVWRQFTEMPMARCACLLLSLLDPPDNTREAGLYRRRSGHRAGGLFDDISSFAERAKAKEIYAKLCERHSERLATCRWLRPVLAGRAHSFRMPPSPLFAGSPQLSWPRVRRATHTNVVTQYADHPYPSFFV